LCTATLSFELGILKGYLMTGVKKRFGKHLRKIRRAKDLTQEQLAEAVGITPEFLSNLERGVNGPSFDTLQKLADVLEVDVSEFFTPPDKK
jgi:transcriptional regulator with XRE-family HTH domain